MIPEISQTYRHLNPEINEAIEKQYLNLNLASNEQQKKGVFELHKFFLERLSKNLEKGNIAEITDLILDKSIKISEITKEYEWTPAETLKVPNLFRNTNLLYTYVRTRLNLLTGKGIKLMKDGATKAIDALTKILGGIIDENIKLENNLIYICFEDLLSFYVLSKFNEQSKELIDDLIDLYKEESNIEGLAKMESIASTAEDNFFKGALVALFQFKLDLITSNKDINVALVENISKHEKILRNKCFLLDAELVWSYSCYKFFNENKNESDYQLCQNCFEIFFIAKNYKQFLLTNKSNFISLVSKSIEKLRCLIIIIYVKNKINLSDALFMKLDYEPAQIYELKSASSYCASYILKLIKANHIDDYILLNFIQKITTKLNENEQTENLNDIQKKFSELIMKKEEDIDISCIKNKEDYLKIILTDKNLKYKDLLKF